MAKEEDNICPVCSLKYNRCNKTLKNVCSIVRNFKFDYSCFEPLTELSHLSSMESSKIYAQY